MNPKRHVEGEEPAGNPYEGERDHQEDDEWRPKALKRATTVSSMTATAGIMPGTSESLASLLDLSPPPHSTVNLAGAQRSRRPARRLPGPRVARRSGSGSTGS